MTYAVTGHRPDKLGSHHPKSFLYLREFAVETLKKLRPAPTRVITSVAPGWDQAIALACVDLSIPFIAAVPFEGQDSVWFPESRTLYRELLGKAQTMIIISPGEYSREKMRIRNEWMVNECEALIALWNGTVGGTCNCVKYAQEEQKKVINVWDKWITFLSIKEKKDGDERRLRLAEKRKRQNNL